MKGWCERAADIFAKHGEIAAKMKSAPVPSDFPTMRKMLSLLNRIARDPNFTPQPEPESTKKNAGAGRKKKVA